MRLSRRVASTAAAITAAATSAGLAPVAQAQDRSEQRRVGTDPTVRINDSFISPLTEVFGDVRVGHGVFVASNSILRADPNRRVCVGDESNVQDNVSLLALAGRAPVSYCGPRSASTAGRVSIAHQAEIRNSRIGEFTFVGFRARLRNVVLEDGAFVLHGATLVNVRIPRDRLVPVGAVIRNQRAANALPRKDDSHAEFQEEVLHVNEEFAENYQELHREQGHGGVVGAGPAPTTSFNGGRRPRIGKGTDLATFARVVGDVRIGRDSEVGRRTSIRADEGAPIIIGANADIDERVTFHALKGTDIRIGQRLETEDNVVFHGPLEVGDRLKIADDAVLFRSDVGDGVTIGEGALVIGPGDKPLRIPSGTTVPANAKITTQAQVDALR